MKKEPLQFGNFTVTRESGKEFDHIRIKAVSGIWGVSFRSDNEQFERIRMMANDKQFKSYFESWITMVYLVSNGMPDLDFIGDFFESYNAMNERFISASKTISDEEDAKIIEEEKKIIEIKEELQEEGDSMNDIEKICDLQKQVCEYEYILRTLFELSNGIVRVNAIETDNKYANEIGNFILKQKKTEPREIRIRREYSKEEFKKANQEVVTIVMALENGIAHVRQIGGHRRKYMDSLMRSISERLLCDGMVRFSILNNGDKVVVDAGLNVCGSDGISNGISEKDADKINTALHGND